MIECKHVDFSYGDGPVLSKVSFSIEDGSKVCIIGPNGGGKSTLLRLILGILKPQEGEVLINGKRPQDVVFSMGYVPQHIQFDSAFPITVEEVVFMGRLGIRNQAVFRPFITPKSERDIALEKLAQLGIADLSKRRFSDLSGGQRQRVLIARALASNPQILLLDEPMAHVDVSAAKQLHSLLEKIAVNLTMLTVSHDLSFVEKGTDKVLCVNQSVRVHQVKEISGDVLSDLYGMKLSWVNHSCCLH